MNAVSVADPSVWNQPESRGTLRKRKYLTPPTSPERSSSQSSGYMTTVFTTDGLRLRSGSGGIVIAPAAGSGTASDSTPSTCWPGPVSG